jgi:TonB family protein
MNQSLDSLSDKRCPKCEIRYESTRLRCPRDNTLLVKIKVPSFNSIPSHSSTRPIGWLLVAITLGGSAFVAYRANSYFSKTRAPVSSPIVAKTEQPTTVAVKTAPVIGGELVGTELFVPDAEYPAHTAAGPQGVDVSGTVTVRVHVNQKGMVISAQALDGDEWLQGAAVTAGKNAAFSPEKLRGKGRTVTGTITYYFVAPKPSASGPSNVTASKAAGSATQGAPTASESSPATGSSPANASANSSAGDDQFPLTGGPLAGTELNLPKPQYPSSAKSKGISGTISVVVRVNRAGKVISWRTGEGDSQLRAAALKAAKQATFSPAKLPGKGEVVGTITYSFKL